MSDKLSTRSECEQFTGRLRQLCDGTAGIPVSRMNAYRGKWGLPPLKTDGYTEVKTVPEIKRTDKKLNGYGPGSQLVKRYKELGVPPCQACYDLACTMDELGTHGCTERVAEFALDILPRAKTWIRECKPWISVMLGVLPDRVEDTVILRKIESDIRLAISLSEKAEHSIRTETKKARKVVSKPIEKRKTGCCG